MNNLLIFDIRIKDLNDILKSLRINTFYILLDYYNDTFEILLNKILNLNITNFNSIGLVRHGYYLSTYKLLDKQLIPSIIKNINIDLNISSWFEIINFIDSLKNIYNITFFDFISCRLDKYPEYDFIFNKIQEITNLNIGATADNIGNLTGNWLLTNGNRNLLDIYFTNNILYYQYVFFEQVVSITPNTFTKYYDGVLFTNPTVIYNGFINDDNFTCLSGNLTFYGTFINAINVGVYSILVNGLSSYDYYLDFQQSTLIILPVTLNISINNYVKIYDGLTDIPNYVVNYSGFIDNDDYTCLSGFLSLSGSFLSAVNVNNYSIIPYGYKSLNYNIIYNSSILTIEPVPLLIIANDFTKIYDNIPYFGGNVIYDGFVNNESYLDLTGTLSFIGNSQGAVQIGTYTLMPCGLSSINYSIMFISSNLIIYTNNFYIKANDFAKFYDKLFFSNPSISLVNNISDLSGTLYYSGTYQSGINVDNYTINASGLYSNNYNLTYFSGTLQIDKNELYIIADNINKIYDGISYTEINVNFIGLQGTDTSAILQGSLLNLGSSYNALNVGVYTIIPSNLYSYNYSIIYKQNILNITHAPLFINTRSFTKIYDGTNLINNELLQSNIIYSISGIKNNEIINIISYFIEFKNNNVGQYFIDISNITLSGFTLKNYYISKVSPVIGYILQKPITISFSNGNKIYDTTTNVYNLSYSLSGILSIDNITITYFAKYRSSELGVQIIDISNITLSGFAASNYYISYVFPIQGLLFQNLINIYFSGGNKLYDSNINVGLLDYYIEGTYNEDNIIINNYRANFRKPTVGNQIIDITNISLSGTNYFKYRVLDIISISATINPVYLTIKYDGGSKIYDSINYVPELTYTICGLINFETISSSYNAKYKNVNVGLQYIDISNIILYGTTVANYLYYPVKSIQSYIDYAKLNIIFSGGNKIYNGITDTNILNYTISGLIQNEFINNIEYNSKFKTPNIGYNIIDVSNLVVYGSTINNYYILSNLLFSSYIYPKSLVINFSGGSKIYDSYRTTGSLTYSIDGIVNNEYITISNYISLFKNPNYGQQLIDISNIILNGQTINNYIILPVSPFTANIYKKNLFAIFSNGNKIYDGTLLSGLLNFYLSGLIFNENITISSYTSFFRSKLAGNNFIDISNVILYGTTVNNYYLNPIPPLLSYILCKNLIITFDGGIKNYDSLYLTGTISANISGIITNDDITLFYTSIFRNILAGKQYIDISNLILLGNDAKNYNIIYPSSFISYILPRPINLIFENTTKIYDSTNSINLYIKSISNIVSGEYLTISFIASFKNVSAGNQYIDISNISIYGLYASNYSTITFITVSGIIYKKELYALFTGGNKIYNGTIIPGPLNVQVNGLLNNDTINILSYKSQFRSKNVGLQYIDVSEFIFDENIILSNYYILPIPPILATIYKKFINLYFININKEYDSTNTTNKLFNIYLTNTISSDLVFIDSYIANYRDINIGIQIIDISNIKLKGNDMNNYNINSYESISGFIYSKYIYAIFSGGNKIYDGTSNVQSLSYIIIDSIISDNLKIISYNAFFKNYNIGFQIIDISNIILSINNYILRPVQSISAFISYANLYVIFTGGNKIYDKTLINGDTLRGTISGIVNNENITLGYFTGKFKTYTAGINIIDISNVSLIGTTLFNYILNPILPINAYIYRKYLNINFVCNTNYKIYDGNTNTPPISINFQNTLNDNIDISNIQGNFIDSNVGLIPITITNYIIKGTDINNYDIYVDLSLSAYIKQKNVNIIFTGGDKYYDKTLNTGTISYTFENIISNDNIYISNITSLFRNYNTGYQSIDISYIIIESLKKQNYLFYNNLPIVAYIYPSLLNVYFTVSDKIYDGTLNLFGLNYILYPKYDNIYITYNASYIDKNIGKKRIDILNIKLNGDNTFNYQLPNIEPIYSNIYYQLLTINFTGGNKIYDGNNNVLTLSYYLYGIQNNDAINVYSYNPLYRNYNTGLQIIDISYVIINGNNYTNYYINPILSINAIIYPKQLSVQFLNLYKYYDGTNLINNNISGFLSGIINNDQIYVNNFSGQYLNYLPSNTFIDISNIILDGISKNNYYILPVPRLAAQILKRPLSIIFSGGYKIYDGTLNTGNINYTITNNVNRELITILFYFAQFRNSTVGLQVIDISNITLSGLTRDNYTILSNLQINTIIYEKLISVSFSSINKNYDNTNIAYLINPIINGLISKDISNVTISSYLALYNDKFVQNNKIINITNILLKGINSTNYITISSIITYSNIIQKKIFLICDSVQREYNQTTNAIIKNIYLSGVFQDDYNFVSISSYIANYTDKNIGNNKLININNIILNGLYSFNYSIDSTIIYGNIIKKQIIASFLFNNKTYDGSTNVYINSITISNIFYDENNDIYFYNAKFIDPNVGIDKTIIITDISCTLNNYGSNILYSKANIIYPISLSTILTSSSIINTNNNNDYLLININPIWQYSTCYTNNLISIYNNIIISNNGTIYINNLPVFVSNYTFNKLSMIDISTGFICGGSGLILFTNNTFLTTTIKNININNFNSISKFYENIGFIVGNNGIIYQTLNFGNSWKLINSGTNENLNDIVLINNNIIYIVGSNGILLQTLNGGESWTKYTISIEKLNSIYMIDQYKGFIVGNNGTIIKITITSNSITYNNIILNINNNLNNIFCLSINDIIITGSNGIILRSIISVIAESWIIYISGTIVNLNYIYTINNNNINIVGDNGTILKYMLNPSGKINVYDSSNILISVNIVENNPQYYYYLNNLITKKYNLNVEFIPDLNNNFSNAYSNNNFLTVKSSLYYLNNTKSILYDNNIIIYSELPYTNQTGGIFIINDIIGKLVTNFKTSISSISGIIKFETNIDVGYYSFNIFYTINGIISSTKYFLNILPNLNYSTNLLYLIINNSGYSVKPYVNQKNGIFTILDISSNLVLNKNIYIDLSGIIYFNKYILIDNYSFNVTYSLNNVSSSTVYYLTVIPYIIYLPNIINLNYNYNSTSFSNTLIIYNSLINYSIPTYINGGLFNIYDISCNLVSNNLVNIDNSGIIFILNNINVGSYNFYIVYTYNNISNLTYFQLNILPLLKYSETTKFLSYEHNIYDVSSIPIYYPLNGNFTIIDVSGNGVSNNLIQINNNGQLFFGNLNIDTYTFNITYIYNFASTSLNYIVQIKPVFYYPINIITIYYNNNFISQIPYVNPSGGLFNNYNNILFQQNLINIDNSTGIIYSTGIIQTGIFNFSINYLYNKIFTSFNNTLIVIPNIYYNNPNTKLLYGSSKFSEYPVTSPIGGTFSLSGNINNLININTNSGIIFFNNFINFGIYYFYIIYNSNNIINYSKYELLVQPILFYSENSINLLYDRSIVNYSVIPYVNQLNGLFSIISISNNLNLYIDQSGIILFNNKIPVRNYNFIISYTLNNVSSYFNYNLTITPIFNYLIDTIYLLYNRNFIYYSDYPLVDQSGGIFTIINDYSFISIDKYGIISIDKSINVGFYNIYITYTLNNCSNRTVYNIIILPNLNYPDTIITINYINTLYEINYNNLLPIVDPSGGIFSIFDLSNNLVLNNLVNINQNGILTFISNINVGIYYLLIIYTYNNISNKIIFNYNIKPNLLYFSNQMILNFNEIDVLIQPEYYSQRNGKFIINDISNINIANNLVLINEDNGIIAFNNTINVGIYFFNIIYTLNNSSTSIIYELDILPILNYPDVNNQIFYDYSSTLISSEPIYSQYGGIFSINDNYGNLVKNKLVDIDTISGIIIFKPNIYIGLYKFNVIYNLNGLSKKIIYNLKVVQTLVYNNNTKILYYNNTDSSISPSYNINNGLFSFTIIKGSVDKKLISIDSSGIIIFYSGINIGVYILNIIYSINSIDSTTLYYLNIIPNINYFPNTTILDYGSSGISKKPIVTTGINKEIGIFEIFDYSGNNFSTYINFSIYINNNGIINFKNNINVGKYTIQVKYTLNESSNYFLYYLIINPTLSYNPNSITLRYNHINTIKSSLPNINLFGGNFSLYDISNINIVKSNLIYIDLSGILYFRNNIPVGNYYFNILYSIYELSINIIYNLQIIPNIEYDNPIITLFYGNNFTSIIPYYDQSGGQFTFTNISSDLVSIIIANKLNGLFYFSSSPDVGIYNLKITYTLNNISNYYSIIFYILPVLNYSINSLISNYGTSNYSVAPLFNQIGGNFIITISENILIYDISNLININQSTGILYFSNNLLTGKYSINIIYNLNYVSNTTIYYLTILPLVNYNNSFLTLDYDLSGYSENAIYNPLGGSFMIKPNQLKITDIPYNTILNYIQQNLIIIYNKGNIYFDSSIPIGVYNLSVDYTYNNTSTNIDFLFTKIPTLFYLPSSQIINYRTIAYSVYPVFYPKGGIFKASVSLINIIYIDISINPITGILKFGLLNPGIWDININYTFNGITKNCVYNVTILYEIYYNPQILTINNNSLVSSNKPVIITTGGQFSTSTSILGLSINSLTGVLNFDNLNSGLYNISIIYTLKLSILTLNYTLLVLPNIIYNPNYLISNYNISSNSIQPIVAPLGGIFTLNNITNTLISIDKNTGIIYTTNTLNVGKYNFLINYSQNNSSNTISYTIYIYPFFNYSSGNKIITYGNLEYSEIPNINPINGIFSTNNYNIDSNGIIEFRSSLQVGTYIIPIYYTYNNISILQNYNLIVKPIFYYNNNNIELIINNSIQSDLPIAKQSGGVFSFISVSGSIYIPYTISSYNNINNGITLNGYTGQLYFGNKILVGHYFLKLVYLLNNLTSITTFQITVKPYISYNILNIQLYYQTSIITELPVVNPQGGFFSFSNNFNNNNIIINNKTGIINFNKGINVGNNDIIIKYIINNIATEITLNLMIYPIFYYLNSKTELIVGQNSKSDNPTVIQTGGKFSIIESKYLYIDSNTDIVIKSNNIDNIEYLYVDSKGIIHFYNIFIGIYNFTIQYTLNKSSITTIYNLIVKPTFFYDTSNTILIYSKDGYSSRPELPDYSYGGIFGFNNIFPNILSQINIDISNGILYFSKYINVGKYNLNIYYNYNNIFNYFNYSLLVLPLIKYSISYLLLDYNHDVYYSTQPNVNPTKGLFYLSLLNITLLNKILIDQNTGIINIKKIPVDNYNININYYLKNFYSTTNFSISIYPTFYYLDNPKIIFYSNNYTYSLLPFIDPSGGIFELLNLPNKLLNRININNKNGIIIFNNIIDISQYSFNISYTFNNIVNLISYNLIVKPYFNYRNLILNILNNTTRSSDYPSVNPENGIFYIDNIINGITINSANGLITIYNYIPIGIYNLNISYQYNNISTYLNYTVRVLPTLFYENNSIIYGYKNYSIAPSIKQLISGGIFSINPNNNKIFIDAISGILTFNSNMNVNNYSVVINYTLFNILQQITYNLMIIPDFYYDISNIIIIYGQDYLTNKPFINPKGGIFETNIGNINLSGIIKFSNLSISSYINTTRYTFNNIINIYSFNILVKPYIKYLNNFKFNIYSLQNNSEEPIVYPNNGYFYLDTSYNSIDQKGKINFNFNQNIGKYFLNIYYQVNNQINYTNYYYYILPYINYLESPFSLRKGIVGTSKIPIVNPVGGRFYINNKNIRIDNSGILIFNSNLEIGIYNINIFYIFNDLSNNFIYQLIITPYIYYNNKIIKYGYHSQSELPINNLYGGIYSIQYITIDNITIDNMSVNNISIDISSGIISFNNNLNIGIYSLYIKYLKNNLSYIHKYNLSIVPNIFYNDININQYNSSSILPSIASPPGGIFIGSLPSYINLNYNTGVLNIINANSVGSYTLTITYIINSISSFSSIKLNIFPVISYLPKIIIYGNTGFIDKPFISLSGGYFSSYNLPKGLNIDSKSGIIHYNSSLIVNQYYIIIYYLINDLSGINICNILVKPFINYNCNAVIKYGETYNSIVPEVKPHGGTFSSNTNIDSFGKLYFNSLLSVNDYLIPVIYTYNNISNIFYFNLSVTKKNIYAEFIPNDKIYDATTNVIFSSNKLIGIINNDIVYINSYTGNFNSVGPGNNIPILIDNIILGGPDSSNYILNYNNLNTIGNIYYFIYNPNYLKINNKLKYINSKQLMPIVSTLFPNPSFIIDNITISNILINNIYNYFSIGSYGNIILNNVLPIGIYIIKIKGYKIIDKLEINDYFTCTLEVTTDLFEQNLSILPSIIISNIEIKINIYQLQYTKSTGYAYILDNNIIGLLCKFSLIGYYNGIIINNLNNLYPFTFILDNADPSNNIITYKINDDGSLNNKVFYKLNYIGNNYWTTNLQYSGNYYIQDLNVLENKPIIEPLSNTFYISSTLKVTINSLPNSIIYYTIDGSIPTIHSQIYSEPIYLSLNTTINAFAVINGYQNSLVATEKYIIYLIPCILSKTLIRTPIGDQYIDNLKDGDLIVGSNNKILPIIKIIKYTIDNPTNKSYPICIPKDYFKKNVPDKNTYISQNHAIKLFDNKWIYGYNHLNYFNLYKIKPVYFHILLPDYFTDNLIANNMEIESWSGYIPINYNIKYIYDSKIIFNNKEYITYKKIKK